MRSKRGVKGAKRIDTQAMRAMIGSQQTTTSLGVVRLFPGEESHFFVDTDNGTNDVMVDVELIPSGTRVSCRLGFGNDGVYKIPRVNQEVAVLLPFDSSSLIKDPLDFEPIIVGVLDKDAPTELDGDDIVVLKATRVHIVSDDIKLGDTASDPVVRKSDLDTLVSTFNSHTHTVPITGAAGTTPSTAPLVSQSPIACSDVTKSK